MVESGIVENGNSGKWKLETNGGKWNSGNSKGGKWRDPIN